MALYQFSLSPGVLAAASSSSSPTVPCRSCALSPSPAPLRSLPLECRPSSSRSRRQSPARPPMASAAPLPELIRAGEDLPANYASWLPVPDPSRARRAGVLLHPTSLPGPHGIGDLGAEAIGFLDWLYSAGVTLWQVLPLVPPGRKSREDGSPYSGQDANCGNTLLISLQELVNDGLLMKDELPEPTNMDHVDYTRVAELKDPLIAKAAKRLIMNEGTLKQELNQFRKDPQISSWLEDAALFAAIDQSVDEFSWDEWPEPLKNRHLGALEEVYQKHKDFIEIFIAQQFLFQRQWKKVRAHARRLRIDIMGDMPIYVGHHSADVWANRKSFMLEWLSKSCKWCPT